MEGKGGVASSSLGLGFRCGSSNATTRGASEGWRRELRGGKRSPPLCDLHSSSHRAILSKSNTGLPAHSVFPLQWLLSVLPFSESFDYYERAALYTVYRVTHLLADLDLVDKDLGDPWLVGHYRRYILPK